MKTMKKLLALLLAFAMVLSLAACQAPVDPTEAATDAPKATDAPTAAEGSTDAPTEAEEKEWFGTEDGKPVTLRLWAGVQPEYGYAELVDNFNEQYKDKGVQVEFTRYVNDTNGNLQLDTYLMGGGEIDVVVGYGSRLNNRVESGYFLDMSDYIKFYDWNMTEAIGAAAAAEYVTEDGCYGFPTITSNNFWLMVNVDMFEKAGVEVPYDGWTYEQFLDACEKLSYGEGQDRVYGIYWNLKSMSRVTTICGSALGSLRMYANYDGTEVAYGNKVWVDGLTMLNECVTNDYCIPLEDEVSEGYSVANTFLAGKCAMTVDPAQIRLVMDSATYPHDFVTALVPGPVPGDEYMTDEYKYHTSIVGPSDIISIAADTPYPEAAFEFVHWYTTGGMAPLIKGGRLPLYTGFDTEEVVAMVVNAANGLVDERSLTTYLTVDRSEAGTILGNLWAYDELGDMFVEETHAMCYGKQTVEQTVQNLVTRGNELIANAMKAAQ